MKRRHGNADLRLPRRWCIVGAVATHADGVSSLLKCLGAQASKMKGGLGRFSARLA
jgi:hypothetical protein